MTNPTPAALLRAAAEKVRQWAPGAAATFGPELAAWLDSVSVDAEQIGADPRAMATAHKILGGAL